MNFQTHKKAATTKNKQTAHQRYLFLFTSWLLFDNFVICGLKV